MITEKMWYFTYHLIKHFRYDTKSGSKIIIVMNLHNDKFFIFYSALYHITVLIMITLFK